MTKAHGPSQQSSSRRNKVVVQSEEYSKQVILYEAALIGIFT